MISPCYSKVKMLELIALEVPQAFLRQEMNMSRLAELLLFVLNRTTNGHDASNFEGLLKLQVAGLISSLSTIKSKGLDKISRVAILAPVAGCLLNLAFPKQPELKTNAAQILAKAIASV